MRFKDKIFIPIFTFALLTSLLLLGLTMTGNFAYIEQTMKCGDGDCHALCKTQTDCIQGEVCCESEGVGICKESSECEKQFEFIQGSKIIQTNNERYPTQERDTTNLATVVAFIILIGVVYFISMRHHHKHIKK